MKQCNKVSCTHYDKEWLLYCSKLHRGASDGCPHYFDGEEDHMTFDDVVYARCQKIKKVLASKADEYATEGDRFHNFKVAARVIGTTPEKALLGMMMKHFVSVLDIIEAPDKVSPARLDEKIGDLICYLCLAEGMITERHKGVNI